MIERDEAVIAVWENYEQAVQPVLDAYEAARRPIDLIYNETLNGAADARNEALKVPYAALVTQRAPHLRARDEQLAALGVTPETAGSIVYLHRTREAAKTWAPQ